eukprot:3458992-Rhodomonas_salina.2
MMGYTGNASESGGTGHDKPIKVACNAPPPPLPLGVSRLFVLLAACALHARMRSHACDAWC